MSKYKVVLSDQVKEFRNKLSDKGKAKFDKSIGKLGENPLKDAKPVPNGLAEILTYLDEIGVNPATLKMTKEQKRMLKEKIKSMDKNVLSETINSLK